MNRKSYILINTIFIVLIISIFLYCYFINSLTEHVDCIHHTYLGIDCPSCGLTRSFSALLHNDSQTALEWNRYGRQIFLFFFLQLIMRILFLALSYFKRNNLKIVLKVDWIFSSLLFMVSFYPFIVSTFYGFYKMFVTGNVDL